MHSVLNNLTSELKLSKSTNEILGEVSTVNVLTSWRASSFVRRVEVGQEMMIPTTMALETRTFVEPPTVLLVIHVSTDRLDFTLRVVEHSFLSIT